MNCEIFFQSLWKGKLDSYYEIQGENAFLEKELRSAFKELGFEILREDLKSAAPQAAHEDLVLGASLFQPRRLVWIQSKTVPEKWSREGQAVWERMKIRADGESLVLILQVVVASSGGAKKSSGRPAATNASRIHFSGDERKFWLEKMNAQRGKFLNRPQMDHLMSLDFDLMALENAVELWSIGGDLWASDALAWGTNSSREIYDAKSNPSFAWVDAVLEGKIPAAVQMAKKLSESGQEFLLLLGLLSKSLKIWSALEAGRSEGLQPPFLVSKIQKIRKYWTQKEGNSRLHLDRLIHWTSQADFWMKSRPVSADSLLLRLSESSQ